MTPNVHLPHISLELAKQLQDAGLEHGFGAGDYGYVTYTACVESLGERATLYTHFSNVFEYLKEIGPKEAGLNGNTVVFAPRVEQLKEEIEKLGYYIGISPIGPNLYRVNFYQWVDVINCMVAVCANDPTFYEVNNHPMVSGFPMVNWKGDNLAELLGQALLWLLKSGKKLSEGAEGFKKQMTETNAFNAEAERQGRPVRMKGAAND